MKFRILIAAAALLAAVIGIRSLLQYLHSPKRAAVGIAMEVAGNMRKPPGDTFDLLHTSFLDSYAEEVFYVVLDFKGLTSGKKLQEVFYFDALDGKPKMEWNYSVFNNLATLNDVSVGAFDDEDHSRLQRKGQSFEFPIALTPVKYQCQAETISRLASDGVEMSVSIGGHPELKPFRIVNRKDQEDPVAEFSSADEARYCAKVLYIKLKE